MNTMSAAQHDHLYRLPPLCRHQLFELMAEKSPDDPRATELRERVTAYNAQDPM